MVDDARGKEVIAMKIASEIVAEASRGRGTFDSCGWSGIAITEGALESIIAAKLEPVREALKKIIDYEQDTGLGMQTCSEKVAETTLALFEE